MGSTVNGIYVPDNGETGWGTNVGNNQRRLADIHVNIKAYGAKGDGATDDTSAIQAALDTGLNVYVPPTSSYYKVSGVANTTPALRMHSNNQAFFGAGYGSRIHCVTVDTPNIYVGDLPYTNDTAVYTGVTISNLRLTGTVPHTNDDNPCILVRSAYGARILHNDISSCASGISVNQRNITDTKPEACLIAGNRIIGGSDTQICIELFGNKGSICTNNQVISTSTLYIAIRDNAGTDDEISNNIVRGGNSGISIQGSDPAYLGKNLRPRVIGNRVVGQLGTSAPSVILTLGVDDAVVQDNYIDCKDYGVWCKSGSVGGTDRAVIMNNFIRTSASTTTAIFADSPSTGNNTDVTVKGNHIEGLLGGSGIRLDTVDGRSYIVENTLNVGTPDAIAAPNIPAGSEVYALRNAITGTSVAIAGDLYGSGSGKFVHWDHSGNTANTLVMTNGDDLLVSVLSPAQITANQNDYDPLFGSGRQSSTWRINSDAARDITGIAGGWSGRRLTLINVGGFTITLKHDSASSAAGNRILGTGGLDVGITGNTAITNRVNLIYDDTTARWRVI
jgi:hypothetical protein